jgi:phage shock protein A
MKEMGRALVRLEQIETGWTDKAELALAKGRDDLARAALLERGQAADMAQGLRAEIDGLTATLKSYEADIARLQGKLREARARQASIASRIESAVARARVGEALHGSRTQEAFARFEQLERRADLAEGMADALGLTGPKSIEEEIAELRSGEQIDAALAELKAARAARIS